MVLLEQRDVVVALARELEHELIDLCVHDRREEEVVVPFPGRTRVAVAVADVQRPLDVDALDDEVDRLHR